VSRVRSPKDDRKFEHRILAAENAFSASTDVGGIVVRYSNVSASIDLGFLSWQTMPSPLGWHFAAADLRLTGMMVLV